MNSFQTEHLILLTEEELTALVSSKNRDDYEPDLKYFLYATKDLKRLRLLSLDKNISTWNPPNFKTLETSEVIGLEGNIRGYQKLVPIQPKHGEAQMKLSYGWFWSEFNKFLLKKKIFPILNETNLYLIYRHDTEFEIVNLWNSFLAQISNQESVEKHMGYYFQNKLIYKQKGPKAPTKATAWTENTIPIVSGAMRDFLSNYYRNIDSAPIKYFGEAQCQRALEQISKIDKFDEINFPFEILNQTITPGDNSKNICAGCGRPIHRKEKKYKRISAFVKDGDERPQSGTRKETPTYYCDLCILQTTLCPIKFTKESLTVRLIRKNSSSLWPSLFEEELRKYTAHSLNAHAGNFISLHLKESVGRERLVEKWGTYHYSLWKMATIFPPQLFAEGLQIEVYPGEETFRLPRWALWFIAALAEWDNVFNYWCYANKEKRAHTHTGFFLRLAARGKVFQAFYVLIAGGLISGYANSWRINRLQEIWKEFETQLKEEKYMPIPDYPFIAGFTGLLLPLAERVHSSRKSPEEKKRAVGKLLEEADKPIQYAYTAARETGSPDFIFCKRPRNRYFYEKAIALLKWAGEDVDRLQKEAEEKAAELAANDERFKWMQAAEEKVFICPDQITRVASALVSENEKPYENEADWRAFAYQVKLALWSMFPQHLGSQDKK